MTGYGDAPAVATAPRPGLSAGSAPSVLSKLGHELRTPLSGIVGLSQLLLLKLDAGPIDPAVLRSQLGLIRSGACRSLATIDRVVEAAKLDAGEVRAALRGVDVRGTVAEVVEAFRGPARERGLGLCVDVPPYPVELVTDPELLARLLHELVDNAVAFAEPGAVHIRVRGGQGRPVAIDVADEGPGIPLGDRDRLLGPFERGAQAAHSDHEGAGLGLYLASGLAGVLGLRLGVCGPDGPGTTFTVTTTGPGSGPGGGIEPRDGPATDTERVPGGYVGS